VTNPVRLPFTYFMCRIFGDNVMSDSCVREWCGKFRDGRSDMRDEGGKERHSTVTDELVQNEGPMLARKTSFHDIRTF